MKRYLKLVAAAAPLFLGLDASAQAPAPASFEVVGTFPQNIGLPAHGLVETPDGSHYGLARFGGAGDSGVLFQVDDVKNKVTQIADFTDIGGEIGSDPIGLAVDDTGKIFGVTPYGGATGDGTLWCWSSANGLAKIANFTGATTGEKPHGNVVWDGDTTLYGICESGGAYHNGTLWKWTSTGGLVRLYSFQNYGDALSLGGRPQSIAFNNGVLYGITLEADPSGDDVPVLWSRSAAGVMKQAAIFDPAVAGYPLGQLMVADTGIVGISYANEATSTGTPRLWRFTGSKTVSIVKTFAATEKTVSIGTRDNFTIYGATASGKTWSWAPDEPFTNLGSIPAATGTPTGYIIPTTTGELYGTALLGTDGKGTVWHWSTKATDVDATFDGLEMGGDPNGLWVDDSGSVYGVETIKQLIWRWSPATGDVPVQIGDVESPPIGFVTFGNVVGNGGGTLYGFTKLGAAGNAGVLWSWDGQSGLKKLGSFGTKTVPGNTTGAIVCDSSGDNIYGTTEQIVGAVSVTHLWRWNATDGLDLVATLDAADGGAPSHTLVMVEDVIYGTTTTGGANDKGTLWAWTAADGVQNLADFGTATVGTPGEGLGVASTGTVYGVTTSGGASGDGRIWKWRSVTGLSVVKDFDHDTTGSVSTDETGLLIASDGLLYGTTANGGAFGVGTLWSCNVAATTPVIKVLKDFDPTEMSHPCANRMMQGPDGMIYGLALHGIWRYGVPSTTGILPAAVTLAPSYVSATRVVFEGAVNALGVPADVEFEFGLESDKLIDSGVATPAKVTGSDATQCSLSMPDLQPNTEYYFRIHAYNDNGDTYGDVVMVKTTASINPVAVTKPATLVGVNRVTLNGLVTPRSDIDTKTSFEMWNDLSDKVATINSATLTDNTPTATTAVATGLLAHTRYYFRAFAENDNGSAQGSAVSVTTLNTPPVAVPDTAVTLPSASVIIPVLANDTDADHDTLSIASFTQPANGAGSVTRAGTNLIFAAASSFTTATFSYKVSDGFGGLTSATVTVSRGSASLSEPRHTLPSAGGSYPINITTTSPWSAVSGVSWITLSPSSGTGNGTVTVTAAPYPGATARIGTIVIGGIAHTLTQQGVVTPTIPAIATRPEGIICGNYQLTVPTTGLPVTYSVSNMPPGLRIDSTGKIQGIPTKAGSYPITVKATNAAGSASVALTIKINDLGNNVVGAFSSQLYWHFTNKLIGGFLSFNTTSAGAVSGTLCSGPYKLPFVSKVQAVLPTAGRCSFVATFPPVATSSGTSRLQLTVTFSSSESDLSFSSVLQDLNLTNAQTYLHPTGMKNPYFGTTAAAYVGTYNSLITLTTNTPADADTPGGTGYMIHKVSATGAVTWTGKLADGTAVSGARSLWPDGSVPLWQALYSNNGGLYGTAKFAPTTGEVTGSTEWTRLSRLGTNDRKYYDGITASSDVNGGRYTAPTATATTNLLGKTDYANNASLTFTNGALSSAEQGASVNQTLRLTLANAAQLALAGSSANLTGVKLAVTPATGLFTGSFTLRDSNVITPSKPYLRTVNYEGLIVPSLSKGAGFFLLSGLPSDPNWKTLSGKVVLAPVN